jgi:N-acetyl-alpha-D-muramate 1-phosphate uridylyltransferase
MQCLILAGGLGTRMKHMSKDLPKSLFPVLGKPFIDYQLAWLADQGVKRVVLSLGYKADMVRNYLNTTNLHGMDVVCVEDGDKPLGTAGGIRAAIDQGVLKGGFFILYGDSYLKADLRDIWRVSENGTRSVMTIFKNYGQWDACNVLMKDGSLNLFQKDAPPDIQPEMKYIDYGLSVMSEDIIRKMVSSGRPFDLADVQHTLSVENNLESYEVFERFYEIGSPQGLTDLENHLKGQTS